MVQITESLHSQKQYKYKAFMSYSHAADGSLAPGLQTGLQRFAKPWYRLRSMRVFRDETSLANTPQLWPTIETALSQSEYFLLLESQDAATSPWVQKEIEYWVSHRPLTTLLLVLTDGQVVWDPVSGDFDWHKTTALPQGSGLRFDSEPKYSDLRGVRSELQASVDHPALQATLADIACTLLDRDKDELIGEDVAQHKRTKQLAWSAVGLLMLLTIASIVGTIFAIKGQQEATIQREIAVRNAETAQAESERSRRSLYLDRLVRAGFEIQEGRNARAQDLLASCPIDLRHWEWHYLWSQTDESPNRPDVQVIEASSISEISQIAISPNNRLLAVGTEDGMLTVWDLEQSSSRHLISAHDARINSVAFHRDSHRIVTGSSDQVVKVWDAISGEELAILSGHTAGILAAGFGRDGDSVVSVASAYKSDTFGNIEPLDNTIRLWNLSTGKTSHVIHKPNPMFDLPATAFTLAAISSNGVSVVTGDYDSAQRWSLGSDRPYGYYEEPHGKMIGITALALSHDGSCVASGGSNGTVVLVEFPGWDEDKTRTLLGHRNRVLSLAFNHDGQRVISSGADSTLRMWDRTTGEELIVLRPGLGPLRQVAFTPDSRQLVAAAGSGKVAFWKTTHNSEYTTIRPMYSKSDYRKADVEVIGNRMVYAPLRGKAIEIWDLRTSTRLGTLQGYQKQLSPISSIAVDAAGRRLVSEHIFGDLILWDISSGEAVRKRERAAQNVFDMALSPDGQRLVLRTPGQVSIWDAERLKQIDSFQTHSDANLFVSFASDNQRLIVSGETASSPRLLDASTGRQIQTLSGETFMGTFSPDGQRIATGAKNGTIRVWDASSGHLLNTFYGHSDVVTALSFDDDNRRLISGSRDKTVRVWGVDSGDELLIKDVGVLPIRQVAFLHEDEYPSAVVRDELIIWSVEGERREMMTFPDDAKAFKKSKLSADWFLIVGRSSIVAYPLKRTP